MCGVRFCSLWSPRVLVLCVGAGFALEGFWVSHEVTSSLVLGLWGLLLPSNGVLKCSFSSPESYVLMELAFGPLSYTRTV